MHVYLFLHFYWVNENLFKFFRSAHFGHEWEHEKNKYTYSFLI